MFCSTSAGGTTSAAGSPFCSTSVPLLPGVGVFRSTSVPLVLWVPLLPFLPVSVFCSASVPLLPGVPLLQGVSVFCLACVPLLFHVCRG